MLFRSRILIESLLVEEDVRLSMLFGEKHLLIEVGKHVISTDLLSVEAIRSRSRKR